MKGKFVFVFVVFLILSMTMGLYLAACGGGDDDDGRLTTDDDTAQDDDINPPNDDDTGDDDDDDDLIDDDDDDTTPDDDDDTTPDDDDDTTPDDDDDTTPDDDDDTTPDDDDDTTPDDDDDTSTPDADCEAAYERFYECNPEGIGGYTADEFITIYCYGSTDIVFGTDGGLVQCYLDNPTDCEAYSVCVAPLLTEPDQDCVDAYNYFWECYENGIPGHTMEEMILGNCYGGNDEIWGEDGLFVQCYLDNQPDCETFVTCVTEIFPGKSATIENPAAGPQCFPDPLGMMSPGWSMFSGGRGFFLAVHF